jgi:hypothetical protein
MQQAERLEALERMIRPVLGDLTGLSVVGSREGDERMPAVASAAEDEEFDVNAGVLAMQATALPAESALAHDTVEPAACERSAGSDEAWQHVRDDRTDALTDHALLIDLAEQVRTIRASDGRYYAAVALDERIEYYRLGSDEFRRSLVGLYHAATGLLPRPAAVANVVAALQSRVEKQTKETKISV